jgi:hypothetical protein
LQAAANAQIDKWRVLRTERIQTNWDLHFQTDAAKVICSIPACWALVGGHKSPVFDNMARATPRLDFFPVFDRNGHESKFTMEAAWPANAARVGGANKHHVLVF